MWPSRLDLAGQDSHANTGYSVLPSMSSPSSSSMSPTSFASLTSLLTPSESHAFHSFLSSVGPPADHALAKATKDLMALDSAYAVHSDALFAHRPPPQDHYSQVYLPHPPSDSSSRTPTPTSVSPFSGRQSSRTRPSHPHPYPIAPQPKQRRPSAASSSQTTPNPPSAPPQQPPQKPALLTASQKKANHIQSEQKRRANIRRGYEALCECVPALREAIREEEEAMAAANNSSRNGPSAATSSSRRKGKAAVKGEEKIDGRAGPRSENVVLSKTIDYINELMEERSALLARLHSARSTLPPGHPALIPDTQYTDEGEEGPLWQREWKGGHGTLGNIVDGDESS
ncbi:hypothetical protein DXG03_000417 [Asterophora parasitica]|uniref:BHLH domain-containing protein n=1 Tax=Asterophora parasitica TaxID=117018 RepID=A0A9P7GBA6_9AGAR|nr:hypothetical protein DXG03_000417 [Asterophora parasitica]